MVSERRVLQHNCSMSHVGCDTCAPDVLVINPRYVVCTVPLESGMRWWDESIN